MRKRRERILSVILAAALASAAGGQPPPPQPEKPTAGGEAAGRLGFADDYVSAEEVAELAAALDYDPVRLFAFVRDQVAFESYRGVLRGALGTLWGRAGNAADQSVLLYSLLRESGAEARYARGTLSRGDAQALLETMFTSPTVSVQAGSAPAGPVADPLNDPALLAKTGDHLWVQMRKADGWTDLDPSFPDAAPGRRRVGPSATFEQLPEDLFHRLRIRVRLERLTAGGPEVSHPLDHEARVADLVGRPVSFGHLPEQLRGRVGVEAADLGRVLAARQRRYLPVLAVGDSVVEGETFAAAEGRDPETPMGQIAQALGSPGDEAGPVSGEWLEFTLIRPDGQRETFEREVFDRRGSWARRQGVLELKTGDSRELLRRAFLSILVAPGRIPAAEAHQQITSSLDPLMAEHEGLQVELRTLQEAGDEARIEQFVRRSLLPFGARLWGLEAHLVNLMMASASDEALSEVATALAVKPYYDAPRVLITHLVRPADGGSVFSLDLRRDAIRAVVQPGQDPATGMAFHLARGAFEAALEGAVVEAVTGRPAVCAPSVFAEVEARGIELVPIRPSNAAVLEGLTLPRDAKARIAGELDRGYSIVVPARFPGSETEYGPPVGAWWRVDTEAGEVVGVLSSGLHQSIAEWVEWSAVQIWDLVYSGKGELDFVVGFYMGLVAYAGEILRAVDPVAPWGQIHASGCQAAPGVVRTLASTAALWPARYSNMMKSADLALKWVCP